MITLETIQQSMSLLPLDPHLLGALPPERRAALELRRAPLRTAPPNWERVIPSPNPIPIDRLLRSRSTPTVTLNSVSTETGEGHMTGFPVKGETMCSFSTLRVLKAASLGLAS